MRRWFQRWPAGSVSIVIASGALWLALGGCSPTTRIVLLPDPDGTVGQVEVASAEGSRVLSEAYTQADVAAGKAPSPIRKTSAAAVQADFKTALEMRPEAAATFLLYFEQGTSDLTEASRQRLPEIFATIKNRQSNDISVIGHTDRAGQDDYNYRLALDRARQVAQLLTAQGADPAALAVTSHGETNPIVETADGVDEPRNRRVEITIR